MYIYPMDLPGRHLHSIIFFHLPIPYFYKAFLSMATSSRFQPGERVKFQRLLDSQWDMDLLLFFIW